MKLAYMLACAAVMAAVTYLIRMLPLTLIKSKINSRFIRSFLYYIPFAVLSAMVVPDIFASTSSLLSAAVGFAAALVLSLFGKKLLTVALGACGAVFVCELICKFAG